MPEKNTPSLVRILQVDYLAHLAFIFLLIIAGIAVVMQVLQSLAGGEQAAGFWPLAAANGVMALLLIGFRVYAINVVFTNGVETPGVIVTTEPGRDKIRLEFAYTWNGENLVRDVVVTKDARVAAFTTGRNVTVLVDKTEPRRVLICDLYTNN